MELYISILILLTNPLPKTRNASLSTISRRLLIKKRNSISDIRDPYGIPIFTRNLYDSPSTTLIIIV